MAVNPPANRPSTKISRQIQASTPVTAATPPHTPAIHLSPADRRSRLIASDGPGEPAAPPRTPAFAASYSAGDDAMVVGQREVVHRTDDDLPVLDDRAVLRGVDAEDRALRRIDDRRR